MFNVLENIVGMLVYATVYLVVTLVSIKILGATVTHNIEKKISEEGNTGLSIISAGLMIGLAILFSAIVR